MVSKLPYSLSRDLIFSTNPQVHILWQVSIYPPLDRELVHSVNLDWIPLGAFDA